MSCAIGTVCTKNGFFMCSTAESTTPKKTDMSYKPRTLLLGLSAHPPASSPSGAYKSKCTFIRRSHSVYIAVRIRACFIAHPPTHTHGAGFVGPHGGFCTELSWLTRVSSGLPFLAPFLRTVYCRLLKLHRLSRQAQRPVMNCHGKMTKTQHTIFGSTKNRNIHTTQPCQTENVRRLLDRGLCRAH